MLFALNVGIVSCCIVHYNPNPNPNLSNIASVLQVLTVTYIA